MEETPLCLEVELLSMLLVALAPTAAVEVDPAQPDPPAPQANPEIQELLEAQASPVALPNPCAPNKPQPHASLVPAVSQDPKDLPAQAVNQVSPVPQDIPVAQRPQESPAQQDPPAQPVAQDNQVDQDSQEPPLNLNPPPPLLQDQPEMQVPQAAQDNQEAQDKPDSQEAQDPRDHPVDQDNQEAMDNPVNLAQPVNPVELERRESAPSTAPSMAESSSRMEPDDDKSFEIGLGSAAARTKNKEPSGLLPFSKLFLFFNCCHCHEPQLLFILLILKLKTTRNSPIPNLWVFI